MIRAFHEVESLFLVFEGIERLSCNMKERSFIRDSKSSTVGREVNSGLTPSVPSAVVLESIVLQENRYRKKVSEQEGITDHTVILLLFLKMRSIDGT